MNILLELPPPLSVSRRSHSFAAVRCSLRRRNRRMILPLGVLGKLSTSSMPPRSRLYGDTLSIRVTYKAGSHLQCRFYSHKKNCGVGMWSRSRRLGLETVSRLIKAYASVLSAILAVQCLTGQAPGYLAEDCQLVADVSVRRRRSADTATCVMRRTSNIFGDRCFAAAGPRPRNSLPINLRQRRSLEQ